MALGSRVGETGKAHNGQSMTIIAYRGYSDIDIQFEDGTIVEHRDYKRFSEGEIRNPNVKQRSGRSLRCALRYEGLTAETAYGKCTLTRYENSKSIYVTFEDGTKVRTDFKSFKIGHIRKPGCNDARIELNRKNRVGAKFTSSTGDTATVIEYKSHDNVDIKFDTGEVLRGIKWENITKGKFIKPVASRVGEQHITKSGVKFKLIEYNGCEDCTIQFETGEIRDYVSYANILKGSVAPTRIFEGERVRLKCGAYAELLERKHSLNCTVKLEDGTVLNNIQYTQFKNGTLGHPLISNRGFGQLGNVKLSGIAFKGNDNIKYYKCTCKKCGYTDILDMHEAITHKC